MQQPLRDRAALRTPRRRLFRRAAGARAFIGLLLLLTFSVMTWQSAAGSQCQRRFADAAMQVGGVADAAIHASHGHTPAADAGTPAPGFTCPVLAQVVRAHAPGPDAGDRSTPSSLLARLVTSADPPAPFRPPRLT